MSFYLLTKRGTVLVAGHPDPQYSIYNKDGEWIVCPEAKEAALEAMHESIEVVQSDKPGESL